MDTLFTAPAPYNDNVVTDLIKSGHWIIASALVLIPLIIIPTMRYMLKVYEAKMEAAGKDRKRIVDLETQIRKQERDQAMKDLELRTSARIDKIEAKSKEETIQIAHQIEELHVTVRGVQNAIERLFSKIERTPCP